VDTFDSVLADVSVMLSAVLDDGGIGPAITASTTFFGDLGMTSIQLVTLGGRLHSRYGKTIKFAGFLADLDSSAIEKLKIGDLVEHIVAARAEVTPS
jgi:acyl carrier protein